MAVARSELYAHYQRTEQMMDNILRDEATMPVVKQLLSGYRGYLAAAHETLVANRRVLGHARTGAAAAIGHAIAFATWRSLTREQCLDNSEAADMMCRLVAAMTAGRHASGPARDY